MTKRNDKSGSPLHPSKITDQQLIADLRQRLSLLRESLDDFTHSQRFFLTAIEAITNPHHDHCPPEQWQLGMMLTGLWLHGQSEDHLDQLVTIERWLKDQPAVFPPG